MLMPSLEFDQLSALVDLDLMDQDIRQSNSVGIGFGGSSPENDERMTRIRVSLKRILGFPL
jgi:hypothetical protein